MVKQMQKEQKMQSMKALFLIYKYSPLIQGFLANVESK